MNLAERIVSLIALGLGLLFLMCAVWAFDMEMPWLITACAVVNGIAAIGWAYHSARPTPTQAQPRKPFTGPSPDCPADNTYSANAHAVRFRTPATIREYCHKCGKRRRFALNETRAFYECTRDEISRHQWCGHRLWIEQFPPPPETQHIHDMYKDDL